MNDGQKSINAGINELIKYNYVHRTQKELIQVCLVDMNILYMRNQPKCHFRKTDYRQTVFGKRKTENRKGQTTNNNRTNNDLTKIIILRMTVVVTTQQQLTTFF